LSDFPKAGWVFAPVERRWAGMSAFGNGLLCDLPVDRWQRIPISSSASRTNRNVIAARATWHGRPLTVLVTHLDRHEDRDAELGRVIQMFLDAEPPVILLGDLNTAAADPRLSALRQSAGVVDVLKKVDTVPAGNVDWIFSRGLRTLAAGLKANDASDHSLA